jgi:hypothetical protein
VTRSGIAPSELDARIPSHRAAERLVGDWRERRVLCPCPPGCLQQANKKENETEVQNRARREERHQGARRVLWALTLDWQSPGRARKAAADVAAVLLLPKVLKPELN